MLLPPVANAKASTSAGASGAAGGGNASAREKRASSISGLGITGAGGAGGDTAVGTDVIAIATHCEVCSACVIDQDQHSIFLG
jgi:hypothetical protein